MHGANTSFITQVSNCDNVDLQADSLPQIKIYTCTLLIRFCMQSLDYIHIQFFSSNHCDDGDLINFKNIQNHEFVY